MLFISRLKIIYIPVILSFLFIHAAHAATETIYYTYDNAFRLTHVASDRGYEEDYAYNGAGNRTLKTITLDVTPPETIITNTPASISDSATATFTFSSSETGSTLACCLDSGEWVDCNSGTVSYSGLADGDRSFAVKAKDAAGNEDQTPAVYTWKVDTAPPVSIISYPSNGTGIISSSYTIRGSASDIVSGVSSVEISINDGPWTQATGTTDWSYNWTIPSEGPCSIRTRATDAAGNTESPHGITVTAHVRMPNIVASSGRQLLVNSSPFTVTGIDYSPVPIGDGPSISPYGDYLTSGYNSIHNRDLPELRQMGANTISLWTLRSSGDHAGFLDDVYNGGVNAIYVIAGYHINPGQNIADANVREQIKAGFRDMIAVHKDHPAILAWAIGSDLNSSYMYGADKANLFSLINEMAAEAHSSDTNHPVVVPLADEGLISTIAAYGSSVPSLDIWGANVYRGNSFGTLFADYEAISAKPLLITGYGIDALNDSLGTEDESAQATYASSLWGEIRANGTTTVGGVLTEYSDQWWMGSQSTDNGCPEANDPSVHGDCGNSATALPDGYDNYEWWGVMRPADNGTGPDSIEKRSVFYLMQNAWCPLNADPRITVTAPNGSDSLQAGTTHTISWTYVGDPGASVQIDLYKGGVFELTIASGVSVGSNCSGLYHWAVSLSQTVGADYSIRITSASNSLFTDQSDSYFAITPACITNAPTINAMPSGQTITANGGTAVYAISITNNDSVECEAAAFSLSATDSNNTDFVTPSGMAPGIVTLAPGASDSSVTLTVNAKAGQTGGTNSTSVTASNANHASVTSAEVTTTLSIPTEILSAGPNSPTSGVNNASIGTIAWSNPGNIFVSDNIFAKVFSVGNTVTSNYLVASGLNFAIPPGAAISGIEVTMERKEGASATMGIRDNSVKIFKRGAITGTEHAGASVWGSATVFATYGSQTDLWGTIWTSADINAANFGVAVSIQGAGTSGTETASVDNVSVKVYYTYGVTCTRNLPTVSLAPASGTITTSGGSLPYTLTLTNNDSASCSNETFDLTQNDSNSMNFNASVLNPASIVLAPGASDSSVTLTVNAKAGQTGGTNNTSVTASSANHTSVTSAEVTTTLSIPTEILSAGPNSPTSGVNNASIGTIAWSNPGNIFVSDNIFAKVFSVGNTVTSNYLVASGLNFAIPPGAAISGIEVTIERKEGASAPMGIRDNSVKIFKHGAITGTEHAGASVWGSATVFATYGSQTDLWGTTWTPADINAANFGVAVSIQGIGASGTETASVDNVSVKVYYFQ